MSEHLSIQTSVVCAATGPAEVNGASTPQWHILRIDTVPGGKRDLLTGVYVYVLRPVAQRNVA